MDVSRDTCVESARKWLLTATDVISSFTKDKPLDIPLLVGCWYWMNIYLVCCRHRSYVTYTPCMIPKIDAHIRSLIGTLLLKVIV